MCVYKLELHKLFQLHTHKFSQFGALCIWATWSRITMGACMLTTPAARLLRSWQMLWCTEARVHMEQAIRTEHDPLTQLAIAPSWPWVKASWRKTTITHFLYIQRCSIPQICHILFILIISSVQFSRSVMSDSLRPHGSQHARPPCPSPTPGVHSDSRPSSLWCHPAISSSVVPFSSRPQSRPAAESFPMSQLLPWGVQSTGASALASFLPK